MCITSSYLDSKTITDKLLYICKARCELEFATICECKT